MKIDVNFDFTTDTPDYWNSYCFDNVLGSGDKPCKDPDSYSQTMKLYHQFLWSKPLPNGEKVNLEFGKGCDYLNWKNFRFGADSICASFRYIKFRYMLEQINDSIPNYHEFMINFIRKTYTIGGSIIFPKDNSINRARGCNAYIKDRWDLTLECIRRYYQNEDSPLFETLCKNKDFFDLFVDFKGYVDFFFLQDCVSEDYNSVNFWIGDGDMSKNPMPQTVDEYLQWIEKQLEFVEKRNKRIARAINCKK